MSEAFKGAMAKLSVVGQNPADLVDCSDLIPIPPALPQGKLSAEFLPMKSQANLQRMCSSSFREDLATAPGQVPASVDDA